MSSSLSSTNLDDILKELEDRFSSSSASTSSPKPRKKRSRIPLQKLLGALVFAVVVTGSAAAMYLSQTSQELRQQAASTITLRGQNQVAGFSCSGSGCNLANQDWENRNYTCTTGANTGTTYAALFDCTQACGGVSSNCTTNNQNVACGSPQKAFMYYCTDPTKGSCFPHEAASIENFTPQGPGGSFDTASRMNKGCGTYQFDFSDMNSPDYSGNCGAVTYNVTGDCTGGGGGGPTPVPNAPYCEVDVVQRVDGVGVALPDDGVLRVIKGEPFTVRARVRNVQNGEVNNVRFRPFEPFIFTPTTVTVDDLAPYEETYTPTTIGRSTLRVNVRFNGYEDAICSTDLTVRVKGVCNEVCTKTSDCADTEEQDLFCHITSGTQGNCRLVSSPESTTCAVATPTPRPTATPTPAPGICLSLAMNNLSNPGVTPKAGEQVNFTCGSVAGASHYRFRVRTPDGVITYLASAIAGSNMSKNFVVPSITGVYAAQCSVCTSPYEASCSAWEAWPSTTNSTPFPSSSALPTATPFSTATPTPRPSLIPETPQPSGIILDPPVITE